MGRYSRGYLLRAVILHVGRKGREWLSHNAGVILIVTLLPFVTVSAEMEKGKLTQPRSVATKVVAPRADDAKPAPSHSISGKIQTANPAESTETEGVVLAVRSTARLRKYPGESADILKVLSPGSRVESTDTTPDMRWTKVRELKDGLIGWVWSALLGSDLPEVREVVPTKSVIESIANSRGLSEKQVLLVRKLDENYERTINEVKAPKLQVRPVSYGREAIPVKLYPAFPTVLRFFIDGKPAKVEGDPFFGDTKAIIVKRVDANSITVALDKAEDTSQTGFIKLAGYPDPVWIKLVGKTVQDVDRPVADQQVDIQVSSPDATEQRNEQYLESVVSGAKDSVTSKISVLSVEPMHGSVRDVSVLKNLQAWVSIGNGKLVVRAPQGWILYDSPSRPSASGSIASTGEKFYEFNGRPDVLTFRNGTMIASVRLAL